MNIKDKLIELGIDLKIDKDKVNLAKEELKKAGHKAQTISNVLSLDGEKLLESLFASKSQSIVMPKVKAPATKKVEDEVPIKDIKKDFKIKLEQKKETETTEETNKQEKLPFWKTNDNINTKNLKIRMNGQNVNDNQQNKSNSPNGRPLPKSTIEELNKKKNRELEQKQGNKPNNNKKFNNQQKNQNQHKFYHLMQHVYSYQYQLTHL